MFANIENLKIESITSGTAKNRTNFISSRKHNAILLRISGCTRYSFDGFHLDLHPGEMVFLPKSSTYSFTALTESPCQYVSVNFEGDITDAVPSVYSLDGFSDAEEFACHLSSLWSFGSKADKYRCYAIFYNLLSYIEGLEAIDYSGKNKFGIIAPAISHLKNHIYDCNLNIEELHTLCNISGTYFRSIFQSHYGTSPQKYILSKRLSHAKYIIDSGDYNSISEIALSVGYTDPLYFSRAFKKKYGLSPMQYAKGQ